MTGVPACSAYKVTVGGATRYGMNYDTWFEHPRIWFETTGFGAAFTGANDMGAAGFSPQAGMNVYLSLIHISEPTRPY